MEEEEFPEDQNQLDDKLPERPLECNECKKPIRVRYTEIEHGQIHETSMCNDCPELQKRLRGVNLNAAVGGTAHARLACGGCGTSQEEIRVGHPLGCSQCYEVFAETIIQELFSMNKLPEKLEVDKKSLPLHPGRAPGESLVVNPSLKLIALNEALSETLKREDYEQAALIRDQISALTGKAEPKEAQEGFENEQKMTVAPFRICV